ERAHVGGAPDRAPRWQRDGGVPGALSRQPGRAPAAASAARRVIERAPMRGLAIIPAFNEAQNLTRLLEAPRSRATCPVVSVDPSSTTHASQPGPTTSASAARFRPDISGRAITVTTSPR